MLLLLKSYNRKIYKIFIYNRNMKGRDTLAEYVSESGRRIKIVLGPVIRESSTGFHFRQCSLRIWDGATISEEYFFRNRDLNLEMVPELKYRIGELAESKADIEELCSCVNTIISNQEENEEREIDDATKLTEMASEYHQAFFTGDNGYNFLHII